MQVLSNLTARLGPDVLEHLIAMEASKSAAAAAAAPDHASKAAAIEASGAGSGLRGGRELDGLMTGPSGEEQQH